MLFRSIVISHFNTSVSLGNDVSECANYRVLDAGSGYSYVWQDGSTLQTFTALSSGNYSVTITDGNLCKASDDVNVTFTTPPLDLGNNIVVCDGIVDVVLDAGSGYSYQWQDGATTQTYTAVSSGVFAVTIIDGSCEATDAINITTTNVSVDLGVDQSICGANYVLDAGSGYTYHWQDGSSLQTLTALTTGSYAVTVSDGECDVFDAINLTLTNEQIGRAHV